ncbi:RluA family pseudouridine synthase [Phenylobacterium sp. 20VBR1]|uniref:Pseudouridine synthase n=1 Tax=Phenylobacterium glaciei TaxID=2803784 RepID=A0A941D4C3_9CAUL|nr:RluA family pseudouridine synthase [Phenylobacterium glaciei]MBR7621657.1 RluA family pseudouridine synthase [Phenylobacterium glaciei]
MNTADDEEVLVGDILALTLTAEQAGGRLDKTLAEHLPDLSRARIQALMAAGQVTREGKVLTDTSAKAQAGEYELLIPPPEAAEPQAQAIALTVLYEDAYLIVVDKPPGMAVHPAPGTPSGTLVNALLHHCGDSLSGIGGVARPGIVHRIDKETSGVVVVAKTDAAHQGLSALFAAHDIDRIYVALVRGAPTPPKATIVTQIGRSSTDRKKMAVLKSGGREAITHYSTRTVFGQQKKPQAARLECTLETGRTHQIRVHLASKGSPCLGDPVYGSGPPTPAVRDAMAQAGLTRQALHAAVLGFVHPVTGETLRFESPLPPDMAQLEALLSAL